MAELGGPGSLALCQLFLLLTGDDAVVVVTEWEPELLLL